MRIRIEGPFETSFSFSLLNRGLAGALARQPGVALGLRPSVPPGNGVTCRTTLASDDELAAFCRTAAARSADWVIRLVYPPVTDPPEDGARLAISFPWEETLVPGEWIEAMNREAHLVIALSEHVRRALRASGLALPIAVVWPGLDGDPGSRADAPAPLPTGKGFRFLHVSSGFPRKGCDVLLRAYTAEFTRAEDVCLLVKTLPQFDHDVAARIRRARLRRLRCPEIVHLDRDLDPAAMQALFRSASCLVHPARAEGFALPIAEAMRARVPVIATRWGGALDYCDEETATLIGGRLAPAASPTRVPGAEWFEPDERELRAAMRAHYERARSGTPDPRVTRAAERVATLTWDRAARATLAAVAGLEENGGAPIRAGMVSSWNVRCGLAEYSRAMIESQAEGTFAWTILAAEGERVREDGPEVVRCWREDEPATLAAAVEAALARRLDLVHFQLHLRQLGHPHAAAVARLREAGVRVFATLHSTREAPAAERFAAALGSVDRIFVHATADRLLLERLGLRARVVVLPHGFPGPATAPPARTSRAIGRPLLATVGFLRPHKGTLELLDAVARVARRRPEVGLLALTSLYPGAESSAYLDRCLDRTRALGLESRVRFVTDFLPVREMVAALAAADVIVLPYRPSLDSTSAAVRVALAAGRPTIVVRQAIFADVAGDVHAVAGASARSISRGVLSVLDDAELAESLARRASARAARDAWSRIGPAYGRIARATCRPALAEGST